MSTSHSSTTCAVCKRGEADPVHWRKNYESPNGQISHDFVQPNSPVSPKGEEPVAWMVEAEFPDGWFPVRLIASRPTNGEVPANQRTVSLYRRAETLSSDSAVNAPSEQRESICTCIPGNAIDRTVRDPFCKKCFPDAVAPSELQEREIDEKLDSLITAVMVAAHNEGEYSGAFGGDGTLAELATISERATDELHEYIASIRAPLPQERTLVPDDITKRVLLALSKNGIGGSLAWTIANDLLESVWPLLFDKAGASSRAVPVEQGATSLPDVESVSEKVHEAWMTAKRKQGVETRTSEWGEELMVPYPQLSNRAKELDRATVVAIYAAIREAK